VLGQYQDRLLVRRTSGLTGWMGSDGLRKPRPVAPARAARAPAPVATTTKTPVAAALFATAPVVPAPAATATAEAAPVAAAPVAEASGWNASAAAGAVVKAVVAAAARVKTALDPTPVVSALVSAAPAGNAPVAGAGMSPETEAKVPTAPPDPEKEVTSSGVTLRLPNTRGLAGIAVMPPLAGPTRGELAPFAGQWTVRSLAQNSEAALGSFRLMATPSTQGWSVVFQGRRDSMPMRVVTGGDSVVMRAGPYASVFRKGVTVSFEMVTRIVNGGIEGSEVVRYHGGDAGPDSVVTFRLRGTRLP